MEPGVLVFLLLVAAFLSGVVAASIAGRKGRSVLSYFVLGFVFGIFGVIVAAVVGNSSPRPPKGWKATACPRCYATQNIERGQSEFGCWQCEMNVPVERV